MRARPFAFPCKYPDDKNTQMDITQNYRSLAPALLIAMVMPVACAEQPGEISRDTEPFDGIAETASIFAVGNEPFWNASVQKDQDRYVITYATPDTIDGESFAASRFAGNNGLSFSGELDGSTFDLALTPGRCSDTMSDRIYPYTATVALGDQTLFGCAYTSDQPVIGGETP